ncbi:PREDICTED: glutamate-rich protein 3 isoform X1 [Myotis brandtii]|uniref:glutamate-rich protein 3 isoform X1 n=2 Tax=Myotis brandtii TaxID=109478 RepID=UPI0003BC0572|nr:PREDICTED: glutamate-rich protein 3 isoform X1 [Myotis brandtii]
MSHSHPAGLLAAYNSLTDKHLTGYFNNTRIRRHLLRSGLITRNGRILSEKEYKLNIMKRDHQKYIRECLAQAIFHKVLDMERYHQLEIKKKLETLARKERIQRFKGEPTRWSIEKNMPVLSPHPPVGPKTNRGHSVLVDEGHSSPITVTAPRPHTAPGMMQPPIRLQPLPSHPAAGTVPKVTPGSRSKTSPPENEAPFPIGGKKAMMKLRNSMDNSQGMKQYQPLNINSYMMPVPPPPPSPNGKITRENRSETWRRRRFRSSTAPNGLEPVFTRDSRRINKTPLHSNAVITMIYLGKTVHLRYNYPEFQDEIQVYQQHCGGENLCVYRGKLLEKETFQFISKRHHGFPFSLTFFLNGMQVNRLSSCCEYKHRKGSRLGGKGSYFGFVCVERSSPCYKCIIAMGLDKKPTSPKPRKQKSLEKREEPKGEGKLRKDRAYMVPRRNEMEGSKTSSVFFSADEEKTGVEDVRTAVEEMERKGKQHVWEDDQENIFKYEYEEDFEVDEEKQDEKANKEGQADDQMNEMSKSPSDDEKDNLDPEKDSETSSQKAPDADDSVKDESDGCSDSELEEDKQDIKTASSSSCRSHPYSSCSEDESVLEDREAHAEDSADESVRSSSSQELSENDEPGKSHLPTEDSLEIEDQKIIKANVGIKTLPREESLENVLEEETENRTQVIAEGLSEESQEHVSKEEKKNYRNKLWKGSTAKGKDKKAGLCRVEKGVGQILGGAVEPGCHYPCDAESGVNSTDEEEKLLTKLEIDTGAVPNRILVAEESTALTSNKESKPVASEMYTVEKEEAVEEDGAPQHRDADTLEEKGGVTLGSKAGINEIPLGEWKPTAEQPALVALFTGERESPQGIASRAEAEGARELDEEGLKPMAEEAARASGSLNEEEAPEQQALMQTVLETEKAASEEEQSSEKVVFACKAAAQNSECVQEVAAPREAVMLEKGEAERGVAVSEAGSEKPDMEDSEEKASIDLGDMAPEDDTAFERADGSEEAVFGGEEPAKARKTVMRIETPLSSSTSEKAEATSMRISEESLEELCKKAEKKKDVETEVESNKKDDRKEILPEEFDAARQRRKAERPRTPLGETESEREEVTRAKAPQDEDISAGEQKFKGEEGEIVKEVRPVEETPGPLDETECDVKNAAPVEGPEWTEDTGPQGDDSPREREVGMLEAAPGFEKSPENTIVVRKEEGGERLREAGDTGHKGRAELLCREKGEKATPSDQDGGPSPGGEGVLGAPESDPAGHAQECAAKDQDGLTGLKKREKEGSLQGGQGVGAQEDISEGESVMVEKLSEEVMDEEPEEEVDQECSLETGVMKNGHEEGVGSLQGRMVVAKEDLQEEGVAGMADEKREVLADLKTAEEKTEANTASSLSDVADEKTWHKVDELLEKTVSAEKVAAEEIALSMERVPAAEEVTMIGASEAEVGALGEPSDLEEKAPQLGPDQKEGEAGMGSPGGVQESGKSEDVRLGLSQQTESELSREGLQAVEILPGKANCPGIQEKQEHKVQRESENTDVSLNSKKA